MLLNGDNKWCCVIFPCRWTAQRRHAKCISYFKKKNVIYEAKLFFRHSKIINASEWMHGDKCQQRCNKIDMLQNYLIRAISIHCRLLNSARSDIPPVYIRSISIKYLAICTSHASESLYHFGLSVIKNIPCLFYYNHCQVFFFAGKKNQ